MGHLIVAGLRSLLVCGDVPKSTPDYSFLNETSENVRELFYYWDRCRARAAMPRRGDFDPMALPRLLPGIILVDVEGIDGEGVGIYRYRLVGTNEVENRRHDPTGQLLSDGYFGPSLDEAIRAYETVRRSGSFLYEPVHFMAHGYKDIDEYSILLPFSEDGETVNQILVYSEKRTR